MPETPYSKFRLGDHTLTDLDALAASNGGNRSAAIRDAVAYWRAEVERAGRLNAEQLSDAEWELLGHTGDPGDYDLLDSANEGSPCRDWAYLIATSLVQMHEGRAVLLASHREEQRAAKKLAAKIGKWGIIRGYALMAALRYFWRDPSARIQSCSLPEIWLTPTATKGE